jgi:hypothetical protein
LLEDDCWHNGVDEALDLLLFSADFQKKERRAAHQNIWSNAQSQKANDIGKIVGHSGRPKRKYRDAKEGMFRLNSREIY